MRSAARSRGGRQNELDGLVADFNYMAERLEIMVNAQQRLVRDVSHELRSPLTRLGVAFELARSSSRGLSTAYLNRIDRELESLNHLITQMLQLSRNESIDRLSYCRDVALAEVMGAIIDDANFEAAGRCRIRSGQIMACQVAGDVDLLSSAVENVVRNAIRYTARDTDVCVDLLEEHGAEGHVAVL